MYALRISRMQARACVVPRLCVASCGPNSDLYGLGTVLYWLLTGVHAYPARSLRDLPRLWLSPVPSVSERCAPANNNAHEALHRELDTLVMSLINENRSRARAPPGRSSIASRRSWASRARAARMTRCHSIQPALVGRERERADLRRRLEAARAGRGECTLYTGRAGAGRSRLLLELTTDARIQGFSVLHVGAKEKYPDRQQRLPRHDMCSLRQRATCNSFSHAYSWRALTPSSSVLVTFGVDMDERIDTKVSEGRSCTRGTP